MTKPTSFFRKASNARSVLIGASDDFDFLDALREAVSIRCAIAFGHMSGWGKIAAALNDSSAKSINIILGQAFFQTEPDLLDLLEVRQTEAFQGRLAPVKPTFHPKVWLIETSATAHLIIGSANLSHGGFIENVECSAYSNDESYIKSAISWFDKMWGMSFPLTPDLCRMYRQRYDKTKSLRLDLKKAIHEETEELERAQIAWRRQDALGQARKYFETYAGKRDAERRIEAMEHIKRCLKPNDFDFTKADWLEFLRIPEFGDMRRIDRDTANHLPQIKSAFKHLANKSIPLACRIDDVVSPESSYHVHGIGRNIVTKVMAMLNDTEMPVYNKRVEETLMAFGYPLVNGELFGKRYEIFCREVQRFANECGLHEVLSIDSFFEYYSRKLQMVDGAKG